MVNIPLGVGDWQSVVEDIPRLRMNNMYIIENPSSPDQNSHASRPTVSEFSSVGTGPIYGIWTQDGSLDGDWLVVSGATLYRVDPNTGLGTSLGALLGDGFCQFAGTQDRVIIVRDGVAYSTDGVTITTVVMPDLLPVGSVACLNSSFLLSVLDDDRFYWILPGDTDPDGLAFATAERSPDPIISINIVSDEIWLLGGRAPEVWTATGDPLTPYQRVSGRVYSDGCAARDTALVVNKDGFPALMWVTDTRSVVLSRGSPSKVSNESVEELLKTATNLRAYTFRMNRHDFYVLTADEFTVVYDIMTNVWSRWDTYLRDNWRAHLGLQVGSTVYAGDGEDGTIWLLSESISDNGEPIIRTISGQLPIEGRTPTLCANVILRVNAGWSPSYEYEPMLELRWSDDQGATYGRWREASLGNKGQYSRDVIYRSLGLMSRPGRIFEFRFAGPARIRIDYAVCNEE